MQQRRSYRRTARGAQLLLCCAILGVLPACQPGSPDPPFDSYLHALSAALSHQPPGSPESRTLPPPTADALRLDTAATGLEQVDILMLSGCAVQRNINRRDTTLGRSAKPSQQLVLALEYLRLAQPCIAQLRGRNDALAELLHDAWQKLQAQLPALIFNATLGSDEFRAFWRAVPAPGEYPRTSAADAAAALHAINAQVGRWLAGDYRTRDRDFELWLAAVAGGGGGALWEALTRRGDALATADRILAQRGTYASNCSDGAHENSSEHRAARLLSRFTRDVQPRFDRSLQRYRVVLQPLAALEVQLADTLPATYLRWMDDRNDLLHILTEAPRRHREQIVQLRADCVTG